jgi:hypothetical protein
MSRKGFPVRLGGGNGLAIMAARYRQKRWAHGDLAGCLGVILVRVGRGKNPENKKNLPITK